MTTMASSSPGLRLLMDAGNSFVKWAVLAPGADPTRDSAPWLARGQAPVDDLSELITAWSSLSDPGSIIGSCVSGHQARHGIEAAVCARWPAAPTIDWIQSEASAGPVSNGYAQPAQLGTDRWAALVGARAVLGPQAALVVMCGTATTIDLLTATGHFTGGVILPGLTMMQTALHERTAGLPQVFGQVVTHPDCTADAMASGCLHAQAGALERLWHLHRPAHDPLICLLAGGAAPVIGPWLTVPYQLRDDLVLIGLETIAASRSASSLPKTSS